MTELSTTAQPTHLLALPDVHGALLADFDYYPALSLLHVRWHGHLTAEALVRGTEAGGHLFADNPLPRRLLSNHSLVAGEWAEALPWLQYEWLPQAKARGVQVLGHVLARNTARKLINYPGGPEFIAAVTTELRTASFRDLAPAWQWITHR